MQKEIISVNEAGQRLDKYLRKYFPEASGSFLYKMLRKKNITLNEKKAEGSEKLQLGDVITFFLSDETMDKFRAKRTLSVVSQYEKAYFCLKNRFSIVYEDAHCLLLNKSQGVLTQKADEADISLNEAMIGYLCRTGALQQEDLRTFKPSVCNRIDRNTSGLVICGKSLAGLQRMSALLKERTLHKFYRCIVSGNLQTAGELSGYLIKDANTNRVSVTEEYSEGSSPIHTNYRPIATKLLQESVHQRGVHQGGVHQGGVITLVEVELITGKTHQIRAHLASIGFPIIGDVKYGNPGLNRIYKEKYGVEGQLLHAYRLEFPIMEMPFEALSGKIVIAEPPALFQKIMEA